MTQTQPSATKSSVAVLVTNNGMGTGDPELQQKLIVSYFQQLRENNFLPDAIGFYTEGVKLLVEGSPVLGLLQEFEKEGILLLACSTCLNFYRLADKLQVGIAGHMSDIIQLQRRADKVITL